MRECVCKQWMPRSCIRHSVHLDNRVRYVSGTLNSLQGCNWMRQAGWFILWMSSVIQTCRDIFKGMFKRADSEIWSKVCCTQPRTFNVIQYTKATNHERRGRSSRTAYQDTVDWSYGWLIIRLNNACKSFDSFIPQMSESRRCAAPVFAHRVVHRLQVQSYANRMTKEVVVGTVFLVVCDDDLARLSALDCPHDSPHLK